MSRLKYGPIDQIGLVVEDLDASIRSWSMASGLGPWTVFRNVSMEGECYGRKGTVMIDVAMAYQDHTQIEMIQLTNDGPCPYRDEQGKLLIGMHHIAWLTDDLDASVKDAVADGMEVVFRAENAATRVAYLAAPGEKGVLFEFIEGEGTRQLIIEGRAAAKVWDGTNPITEIDFAAL
ncbi:MAG: VOC family protein [Novosphingobium sp.]